jgi:inorganic pyrophosphatase
MGSNMVDTDSLWHTIKVGPNPPEEVYAIIENPKNSKNKYELGKDGIIYLDRVLHSSVHFPGDYARYETWLNLPEAI